LVNYVSYFLSFRALFFWQNRHNFLLFIFIIIAIISIFLGLAFSSWSFSSCLGLFLA